MAVSSVPSPPPPPAMLEEVPPVKSSDAPMRGAPTHVASVVAWPAFGAPRGVLIAPAPPFSVRRRAYPRADRPASPVAREQHPPPGRGRRCRQLEEEIRAVKARENESLQRRIEEWEVLQPPARLQVQSRLLRLLELSSESSSDGHETALTADAAVLGKQVVPSAQVVPATAAGASTRASSGAEPAAPGATTAACTASRRTLPNGRNTRPSERVEPTGEEGRAGTVELLAPSPTVQQSPAVTPATDSGPSTSGRAATSPLATEPSEGRPRPQA